MTSPFIFDRFYDSIPNRESVMEFCTSYYHCHYSTTIRRRKVQNLNYLPLAFTWAVEEYSFLKDSFCLNGSDSVCCFSASNNSHLFLPLSIGSSWIWLDWELSSVLFSLLSIVPKFWHCLAICFLFLSFLLYFQAF